MSISIGRTRNANRFFVIELNAMPTVTISMSITHLLWKEYDANGDVVIGILL